MPALAQRGSRVYVCDKKFDTYDSPEIQAKEQDAFLKLVKEFANSAPAMSNLLSEPSSRR